MWFLPLAAFVAALAGLAALLDYQAIHSDPIRCQLIADELGLDAVVVFPISGQVQSARRTLCLLVQHFLRKH